MSFVLLRPPSRYRRIRAIYARGVTGNLSEPWNQGTLFQDSAGTTQVSAVEQGIGRISDTSGSGNHLIQATGASEPVWGKRWNFILNTEDISIANWVARNATKSGTDTILETAVTDVHDIRQQFISTNLGRISRASFEVYPSGRNYAQANASGAMQAFTLIGAGTASGSRSPTIQLLEDGWYACSYDISATENAMYIGPSDGAFTESYAGTAGIGIKVRKMRVNYSGTDYQRVGIATDYDTAGFLPYEKYDGLDDSFTCATGGGSTTAFSLQMAIMLEGAAAAQTLFSDAGANIGLKIERDASNQIVFSGGTGVAFVPATSAALTVGVAYIITCTYDGTTLSIQINNGTPVTATCALSAGTAGFTVGKANGAASSYLLGRRYGMIYAGKNYLMSDAEKLAGKQLLAAKAGISL